MAHTGSGIVVWTHVQSVPVGLLHRQATNAEVARVTRGDAIVVYDPENKARYIVPADLATHTVGRNDCLAGKRSFLCMLHQKGACKAKKLCNQIHLPNPIVREVRQFAKTQPNEGEYTAQKRHVFVDELQVWDRRLNRTVTLPYHMTCPTAGRREASKGKRSVQLCIFHGTPAGCKYGSACQAIHAKTTYHDMQSRCCPLHSQSDENADMVCQDTLRQCRIIISRGNHGRREQIHVPAECVLPNKGLARLLSREADDAKVCARHLQARCTHGSMCNNVHVCRQLLGETAAGTNPHCFVMWRGGGGRRTQGKAETGREESHTSSRCSHSSSTAWKTGSMSGATSEASLCTDPPQDEFDGLPLLLDDFISDEE